MSPGRRRLALLAGGGVLLVTATLGGLVRLGFAGLPAPSPAVAHHGGLLVAGFFATLISLERAVAVGQRLAWVSPIAHAAGGLLVLAGLPPDGRVLLLAGALALFGTTARLCVAHPTGFHLVMAAGTASLVVADALWLAGASATALVPWWALFLVLTIAGERLELSRLAPVPPGRRPPFVALALSTPLLLLAPAPHDLRLAGGALVLLAGWLVRYDVARRTLRLAGLPRFAAACLLAGYGWLALSGLLFATGGRLVPGLRLDAAVHALFLGFVMSMVFAHAPIILPAVLRVPLPWTRALWAPAALLHAGVLARVAGDLAGSWAVRRWAGLANALALLAFAGIALGSALRARRNTARAAPGPAATPARP